MKKININEYDFYGREKIHSDGCESTRYLRDDKIYKFLHDTFRYNRDAIIEQLEKDQVINTPKPFELLFQDGQFVGYSMENLGDLYSLNGYFTMCPYIYDMRLLACKELIDALNDLIKKGYEHYDLHSKNLMVCDGKGRIIDIDSMCNPSIGVDLFNSSYKQFSDLEEENINARMKKNLLLSLCNILFSKYINDPQNIGKTALLKEFRDDEVMSFYILGKTSQLIDNGYSLEDIVNSITEEKIEKCHELKMRR